jgi:hypothetical protein
MEKMINDHQFYSSPNIIRVTTLNSVRWTVYVAGMGDEKYTQNCGRKSWEEETIWKT